MVKDKISLNIFKENTKSSKFPWLLIGNSFTEPYRKVMATVRTWYMSASSFKDYSQMKGISFIPYSTLLAQLTALRKITVYFLKLKS